MKCTATRIERMSSMAAVPGLGWSRLPATFQLGCETLKVPMAMHKTARLKLVEEMKSRGVTCGVVLLEGGEQQNVYALTSRTHAKFQLLTRKNKNGRDTLRINTS